MTRILFWNIENFSIQKINNPKELSASQQRFSEIMSVVKQVNPSVFIIVEVEASKGEAEVPGQPLTNENAINALFLILNELRKLPNGKEWSLVPPVNVGGAAIAGKGKLTIDPAYREGVAVFYKADELKFVGPYVMGDFEFKVEVEVNNRKKRETIEATKSQAPNTPNLQLTDYPDEISSVTIQQKTVNAFSNITKGRTTQVNGKAIPENQFAGQYEYFTPGRKRIKFPNVANRPPFLTKFVELKGLKRTLNVFSVHTSPQGNRKEEYKVSAKKSVQLTVTNADDAVKALKNVGEITSTLGDKEVSVIAGDFNVNSCYYNMYTTYKDFMDTGYTMHIKPEDQKTDPDGFEETAPFCLTTFVRKGKGAPFNQSRSEASMRDMGYTKFGPYPKYGYLDKAYDNFFTKYGKHAKPAAHNHNITIVNTVVGKPYTWAVPNIRDIPDALTKGQTIKRTIDNEYLPKPTNNNPLGGIKPMIPSTHGDLITEDDAIDYNDYYKAVFKSALNKQLELSDHLAISIDI